MSLRPAGGARFGRRLATGGRVVTRTGAPLA